MLLDSPVGSCQYKVLTECLPTGEDLNCPAGWGGWTCAYVRFDKWDDTCWGFPAARGRSMEFCFDGNGVIESRHERPTCAQKWEGRLTKQRRRRLH